MTPVLEAKNLKRDYHIPGGLFKPGKTVHAVKGVSFKVEQGKTLAIVGESGCGKSTLARMVTMIDPITEGEMLIDGRKVDIASEPLTSEMRSKVQIVFQNPYGSLNPRKKIGDILTEPLVINTKVPADERRDRAMAMLKKVGLEEKHYGRYPHMFSGGQRQRVANLLADLQDEFQLTYVFISHDLSVVRHIANDVMVMYFGEAVEYGSRDQVFEDPQHSYTKTLFAATPRVDVDAIRARIERRKRVA
jgi:dipeptide transport system ATP-binding protein